MVLKFKSNCNGHQYLRSAKTVLEQGQKYYCVERQGPQFNVILKFMYGLEAIQ